MSDVPYRPEYRLTVAGDVGPATIKLIRAELDAHDADLRAVHPADAYWQEKARLRLTTTVAALAADLGEEFVAKLISVIEEFKPK